MRAKPVKLDAGQTGKNKQANALETNTPTANLEDSGEKGLADAQKIGPFVPATTVRNGKDAVIFGKTTLVSIMKWKKYSNFSQIGTDRRHREEKAACFPVK